MKQYNVTIYNGGYPLVRECGSISEAYGTMKAYAERTGREVDLDDLICGLGNMLGGTSLGYYCSEFGVDAVEIHDAEA